MDVDAHVAYDDAFMSTTGHYDPLVRASAGIIFDTSTATPGRDHRHRGGLQTVGKPMGLRAMLHPDGAAPDG